MKSIARRIAKLEAALSTGSQPEPLRGWRWRSRAQFHPSIHVRYGNLIRLPEDYQGERHSEFARCLPDEDGRECVEYVEVPGPAPSRPPADPWLPTCIDVIFVDPYPGQLNAP